MIRDVFLNFRLLLLLFTRRAKLYCIVIPHGPIPVPLLDTRSFETPAAAAAVVDVLFCAPPPLSFSVALFRFVVMRISVHLKRLIAALCISGEASLSLCTRSVNYLGDT
jgi:hypothetical protein